MVVTSSGRSVRVRCTRIACVDALRRSVVTSTGPIGVATSSHSAAALR
jgi:hypothetical protein